MLYKRILIPMDGSKTSMLAFQEAISLAKTMHAKLCILHVIEKIPDLISFPIDVGQYRALATKNGKKLLEKFKKTAIKHKIPTEIKLIESKDFKQKVSTKISQAAKSWKANVLVMGTHGRSGFNRFMLGSVAEEILKTTKIPILLVRGKGA